MGYGITACVHNLQDKTLSSALPVDWEIETAGVVSAALGNSLGRVVPSIGQADMYTRGADRPGY